MQMMELGELHRLPLVGPLLRLLSHRQAGGANHLQVRGAGGANRLQVRGADGAMIQARVNRILQRSGQARVGAQAQAGASPRGRVGVTPLVPETWEETREIRTYQQLLLTRVKPKMVGTQDQAGTSPQVARIGVEPIVLKRTGEIRAYRQLLLTRVKAKMVGAQNQAGASPQARNGVTPLVLKT